MSSSDVGDEVGCFSEASDNCGTLNQGTLRCESASKALQAYIKQFDQERTRTVTVERTPSRCYVRSRLLSTTAARSTSPSRAMSHDLVGWVNASYARDLRRQIVPYGASTPSIPEILRLSELQYNAPDNDDVRSVWSDPGVSTLPSPTSSFISLPDSNVESVNTDKLLQSYYRKRSRQKQKGSRSALLSYPSWVEDLTERHNYPSWLDDVDATQVSSQTNQQKTRDRLSRSLSPSFLRHTPPKTHHASRQSNYTPPNLHHTPPNSHPRYAPPKTHHTSPNRRNTPPKSHPHYTPQKTHHTPPNLHHTSPRPRHQHDIWDLESTSTEILISQPIYGDQPVNMGGELHSSLYRDKKINKLCEESFRKFGSKSKESPAKKESSSKKRNREKKTAPSPTSHRAALSTNRHSPSSFSRNLDLVTQNSDHIPKKSDHILRNSDHRNSEPVPQNSDHTTRKSERIPTNSERFPRNSSPILRNSDPVSKSSERIPRNPDYISKSSDHIRRNVDRIPRYSDSKLRTNRGVSQNRLQESESPGKIPSKSMKDLRLSLKERKVSVESNNTDKLMRLSPTGIHMGIRQSEGTASNAVIKQRRDISHPKKSSPKMPKMRSTINDEHQIGASDQLTRLIAASEKTSAKRGSGLEADQPRSQAFCPGLATDVSPGTRAPRVSTTTNSRSYSTNYNGRTTVQSNAPQHRKTSPTRNDPRTSTLPWHTPRTFVPHGTNDPTRPESYPTTRNILGSSASPPAPRPQQWLLPRSRSTTAPGISNTKSRLAHRGKMSTSFDAWYHNRSVRTPGQMAGNYDDPDKIAGNYDDADSVNTETLVVYPPMPVFDVSPSLTTESARTVGSDDSESTLLEQEALKTSFRRTGEETDMTSSWPGYKDFVRTPTVDWERTEHYETTKSQQSPKPGIITSFLEDCLDSSTTRESELQEQLDYSSSSQATIREGSNHRPVETLKNILFTVQSLTSQTSDDDSNDTRQESNTSSDSLIATRRVTEEALSDVNSEDMVEGNTSLSRAYYHLSRLKKLVSASQQVAGAK